MRKYLCLLFPLILFFQPQFLYASDGGAQFFQQQFMDSSGDPVAGVQVYHYEAGTTTAKTVWTDEAKTTPAAQPVEGDSSGVVSFYADGDYKLKIDDADDVTLYTWDNFKITSDTATMWEGNFGESFPACDSDNLWHLFARVCDSTDLVELGICNGTNFETVIDFTAVFTTEVTTVVNNVLTSDWASSRPFVNLVVTNNISSVGGGTSDEQCDVDATEVTVYTAAGAPKRLNDLDLTIDNTVTGSNGRFGVALTVDTWYSVWVVNGDDGTVGGIHTSQDLATVLAAAPSGFNTYGSLVGWMGTDGTSDFWELYQRGLNVRSATGTYAITGAVASRDISAYVPPTAIMFQFNANIGIGGTVGLHPVTFTLGVANSYYHNNDASGTHAINDQGQCPIETAQTIFDGGVNATTNIYIQGWEY
jgi:hypothetical protein